MGLAEARAYRKQAQRYFLEDFVVEEGIVWAGNYLEAVGLGKHQEVNFDVVEYLVPSLVTYQAGLVPFGSGFVLVAFVGPDRKQGQRFAEVGKEEDFEAFRD